MRRQLEQCTICGKHAKMVARCTRCHKSSCDNGDCTRAIKAIQLCGVPVRSLPA